MKHILVLCTANICRSPMVTGLLRQRLADAGLGDEVTVSSAGVFAIAGHAASQHGTELLAERGIDLRDHVARGVRLEDIRGADLILVMEERHRQSVFHYSPESLHKVFLLSELAGRHEDLADPYGSDLGAYRVTLRQMESYLDEGWDTLLLKLGLPGG